MSDLGRLEPHDAASIAHDADNGIAILTQDLRMQGFRWSPWIIGRAVVTKCALAIGLIGWCLTIGAPVQSHAANWRVGVARRNITPEVGLWMAGYGARDRPADGKLTDLWAKALLLDDQQGHRLVVVTLDLVGIDRELSQQIIAKLQATHGLQRHEIVLCTSHTHTGPVVGSNLASMHLRLLDAAQQSQIQQYATRLSQQTEEAVAEAWKNPFDATLAWGSGRAAFAVNRRANPEGDVPTRRVHNGLQGPTDHDVPVLAIRDAQQALRAIVFGYACHATVLSSYQWSGDYPGYAQATLEQDYPGCLALFWAGCGGDQNPLPRRSVELAQQYGHELAGAVKQVLETDLQTIPPILQTDYREIPLAFAELPTREQIVEATRSDNRFIRSRAELLLEQWEQGNPPTVSYPYPIGRCRLGNTVDWIFLGGEVVVDYALRIKSERRGPATWVTAYSHDVMAYIPSRRVLLEGGYEGADAMIYYGLPTTWSPNVESQIVEAIRGIE